MSTLEAPLRTDFGASQLIIDGKLKLVEGEVDEIMPDGVSLVRLDNEGLRLPSAQLLQQSSVAELN